MLALVRDPHTSAALGRNARQALIDHYSWDRHIDNLWHSLFQRSEKLARCQDTTQRRGQAACHRTVGRVRSPGWIPETLTRTEVQKQWDENPCGSQYVKKAAPHTLEWFLEVQAYRYGSYGPWMPSTMEFASFFGQGSAGNRRRPGDGPGPVRQARRQGNRPGFVSRASRPGPGKLPAPWPPGPLYSPRCRGPAVPGPIHSTWFTATASSTTRPTPRRSSARSTVSLDRAAGPSSWSMPRIPGTSGARLYYAACPGKLRPGLQLHGRRHVAPRGITENGAKPLVKVYTRSRLRRMFHDFHARPHLPASNPASRTAASDWCGCPWAWPVALWAGISSSRRRRSKPHSIRMSKGIAGACIRMWLAKRGCHDPRQRHRHCPRSAGFHFPQLRNLVFRRRKVSWPRS